MYKYNCNVSCDERICAFSDNVHFFHFIYLFIYLFLFNFFSVPWVFRGVPGVFRGVPGVFRGVPGCSGSVPCFTDTRTFPRCHFSLVV